MKLNLKKHWEDQNTTDRHIVTPKANKQWHKRLLNNLDNYTLNHIDKSKVKTVLDWGCGGGLLSKQLKIDFHVSSVDISEDSLNNCIKYASPDYHQLVPTNIDNFQWGGGNIDFVHCHALVWHFPTLEYFQKVLDIWVKLSPKYITFNTKPIKENYKEVKNYSRDFLSALRLNNDFVVNLLEEKKYKVVNQEEVTTGKTIQTYFVFEKK